MSNATATGVRLFVLAVFVTAGSLRLFMNERETRAVWGEATVFTDAHLGGGQVPQIIARIARVEDGGMRRELGSLSNEMDAELQAEALISLAHRANQRGNTRLAATCAFAVAKARNSPIGSARRARALFLVLSGEHREVEQTFRAFTL